MTLEVYVGGKSSLETYYYGKIWWACEGWFTGEIMRIHGRSLWKKIGESRDKFLQCINREVGRGDRLSFWKDNWMEGRSLKYQFPLIYSIAQSKDSIICNCFDGELREEGEWQVVVTKNLKDWEINECGNLLGLLSGTSLKDEDDKLRWSLTKNGVFMVKSWYGRLMRI